MKGSVLGTRILWYECHHRRILSQKDSHKQLSPTFTAPIHLPSQQIEMAKKLPRHGANNSHLRGSVAREDAILHADWIISRRSYIIGQSQGPILSRLSVNTPAHNNIQFNTFLQPWRRPIGNLETTLLSRYFSTIPDLPEFASLSCCANFTIIGYTPIGCHLDLRSAG